MTTLQQFQAEQDAKNTIALNVRKWCLMLIDALQDNYREYSIRGHQRYIADGIDSHNYHKEQIEKLKNGDLPIYYTIETGKKYHKIVFHNLSGGTSVHCFVDKNTGEVYKSASWKSPAKGVRFDMRSIENRNHMLEICDWSGGYLYAA